MTRVVFYHNAPRRIEAAHALLEQLCAAGKTMAVFVPDPERAQLLDRLLWTQPATGFIPHCGSEHPLAGETPVVLFTREAQLADTACPRLFNLAEEAPRDLSSSFARFSSLIEIVGLDPAEREHARERVRQYKAAGFAIKYIDLGENAKGEA